MYHGHPVINGYSGYFPKAYEVVHRGFDLREPALFDALAAWGSMVVMIDTSRDVDAAWVQQLEHRPGTTFLGHERGWKAFLLQRTVAPPDVLLPQRLAIEAVSTTVNDDHARLAIDGDPDTRWASGPQNGTEIVTIDLGAERYVDGVTMSVGGHITEFPR